MGFFVMDWGFFGISFHKKAVLFLGFGPNF